MNFLALLSSPVLKSPLCKRFALVFAVFLLLLFVALSSIYRSLYSANYSANNFTEGVQIFEVQPGSSLSAVADQLSQGQFISSALLFKILARWRGVESAIKVGEYEVTSDLSAADILKKMVSGDTLQYRVTLLEGWSFKQALDEIWSSEKIDSQLKDRSLLEIAQMLGLEQESPEGMLFPDTYFYTKGESDLGLLRRSNRRLMEILESNWNTRLGALPLSTPYEALVLASIVEKESADNSERAHISGVFIRRLELGMRLQSDPTVIYGMGDNYQGNIRRSDLQQETAYNTYRIPGLPPTPIALAGEESISAALNPLFSQYLYFVARGDGSHQFSNTLEEHNQAVRLFQLSSEEAQ